jgi:4-oxalocrotonate tautomerase
MPQIIVKWYPGRSQAQKEALADAITREVVVVAGCNGRSISVAIEDIPEETWAEAVHRPDIHEKENTIVRKPGYNPFAKTNDLTKCQVPNLE